MSKQTIEQLFFDEMKLLKEREEINKRLRDLRKEKNEVFVQFTLQLDHPNSDKIGGENV